MGRNCRYGLAIWIVDSVYGYGIRLRFTYVEKIKVLGIWSGYGVDIGITYIDWR